MKKRIDPALLLSFFIAIPITDACCSNMLPTITCLHYFALLVAVTVILYGSNFGRYELE